MVGEARIQSVVKGKPKEIWGLFERRIGIKERAFREYCCGRKTVYAVLLEDVLPYPDPLPWTVFSTAFNAPIKPPQSYQFIHPTGFALAGKIKNISMATYKKFEGDQIPLF